MKNKFKSFFKIIDNPYFILEKANSNETIDELPYYRISGKDSVIAAILDNNDNFIMIEQYRYALEAISLEIPAGSIDDGETPKEAINREIEEETNLKCRLISLGKNYRLMMNRTNIKEFLFFGMHPEKQDQSKIESGIKVIKVPRKKLFEYTINGRYQQLAGIAIFHLVSNLLGIDIIKSPYDLIEKKFNKIYKAAENG